MALVTDNPQVSRLRVDGSYVHSLHRMGCGGALMDANDNWISRFSVSFGYGNAFLSEI